MSNATLDAALGIVDRLLRSADGYTGTTITVAELEKIREAVVTEIIKPKPVDTGGTDPECYYAKSCGYELGTCRCKEFHRVPTSGIYHGEEETEG